MADSGQSERCILRIREAADRLCSETNKLRDAMIDQVKKQLEHQDVVSVEGGPDNLPLYFQPGNVDLQKLQDLLGCLEVEENDVKNVKLSQMSSFKNGKHSVDVLMSNSKVHAWVCDDQMNLCLVDKHGMSVIKHKVDHVPESIAISSNGTMYFTSYKEKAVKKLDKSGKEGYVLNTSPLHPVGLALTSDDDLLICVVDTFDFDARKGKPKEILKVTITGEKITSVKFKDDQNSLTSPYRVAENINGDVLVIDGLSGNSGRLVVFSGSGEVKFDYHGNAIDNGNPFCPMNLCVDYNGNIFLLDGGSHCIHVLNSKGELQRLISSEEVGGGRPFVISIGRDGYLWVGDASGDVSVYRYHRTDVDSTQEISTAGTKDTYF